MSKVEPFESLLMRSQAGDAEAEAQLLECNLPLVHAIARRYKNRGAEQDDLAQLGAIGLLKAIRRFDPGYGVCFSTYAVPLIAGEIKRFLRDDGIIKFSRAAKELSSAMHVLLEQEPNLPLSELAERFHVSEADVAAALSSTVYPRSLDEPDQITGEPFGVSIASESRESESDDRLLLHTLLAQLDPREQAILSLRYQQDRTQTEVGQVLGISQVQVSRLEKKILQKLRKASGAGSGEI